MPKKPVAPVAGPTDKQQKGDPRFASAFDRWKAGTSLAILVAELKVTRSQLRRELTRLAGGKDAFKAERATGAGGTASPFGGKRGARQRSREEDGAPAAEETFRDEGVPFVVDTSKSAGWSWRVEYQTKNVRIKGSKGEEGGTAVWREVAARVYIDPDGVEYVEARPTERADLLRLAPMPSMPTVRLRRLETSSVARKLREEEKLLERGAAALERTKERKRAAREARVTRKAVRSS